jgi:hypothetical protein
MDVVTQTVPFPAGPDLFFAAALAGFGLAIVAIHAPDDVPNGSSYAMALFIWAGLLPLFFLVVAAFYFANS